MSPRKAAEQSRLRGAAVRAIEAWSRRHRPASILHRVPAIYFLGGLLFALLAILPLAWGIRPLPYYLGYAAQRDVESRVQFTWHDVEREERRIAALKAEHARRYREIPEAEWIHQVSGSLWHLFEQAAAGKKPAELLEYAKSRDMELEPEQAGILIEELQSKKNWIKPFYHIVAPLQDALRERIYQHGLLSPERYAAERGRTIRIENHLGEIRRAAVSARLGGPISETGLRRILDESFSDRMHRLSVEFRSVLRDLLLARMRPTLVYDPAGTQADLRLRINEIRNRSNQIEKGEALLHRGERVTPSLLRKLRAEADHYRSEKGWESLAQRFVGKAVLILAAVIGFLFYLCSIEKPGPRRNRRALGIGLFSAPLIALAYLAVRYGAPETLLPIGLLAGAVALLMGERLAILAVTMLSLILLVVFEGRPGTIVSFLAAGWFFGCVAGHVRHRLTLLSMTALAGLFAALAVLAWGLAEGQAMDIPIRPSEWFAGEGHRYLFLRGLSALAAWLGSGVLLLFLLPLFERAFGASTDIALQELQDQEHPCLRQLVVQAPGTYHHSVIVGTLAEAAAEAVDANPLLARVGSYYHDIGKLMKPSYFSENETGVSRHENLSPALSTLIIIAHVKDGAEMAREYGLPRAILDIIEQHHGRGLVSYFHHRAQRQAGDAESVNEESFRYAGPLPQTPEAAVVMLADSVEAASRALESPSPSQIRKRVHEIAMNRLLDGQLDASGLTLEDLAKIEDAFVRILTSMFHSRVKYPDAKPSGKRS